MSFVIGRADDESGPSARIGTYRALDGSSGASLSLDLDGPHAALVVGKRGYGKSYTLGVLAEELARAPAIAPVVVDPMGVFSSLAGSAAAEPSAPGPSTAPSSAGESSDANAAAADVPATVVDDPAIAVTTLDPRSWCALLDLSPESGAGALVWQAAREATTLAGMRARVADADAPGVDRRAAVNHLDLADAWGVFGPDGLSAPDLGGGEVTVLDVSGLDAAPMNAVVRGVGETLYRARVEGSIRRLPWCLVDEAHAFFGGVAEPAIERLLTRGRAPGVSVVLATQRPSAVSEVAVSQSDVVVAHRLTSETDLAALEAARPTYMDRSLGERLPTAVGDVLVVDDATESVHAATVRRRDTPHAGDSPSAREVVLED